MARAQRCANGCRPFILFGVFNRALDPDRGRHCGVGVWPRSSAGPGRRLAQGAAWRERRTSGQWNARKRRSTRDGLVATCVGVVTLVAAALGVVVQLKDAFNTVWEVREAPNSGIWGIRTHLRAVARSGACNRFSPPCLNGDDSGARRIWKICQFRRSGSSAAGYGVCDLVLDGLVAVRADVQVAAGRGSPMARCVGTSYLHCRAVRNR